MRVQVRPPAPQCLRVVATDVFEVDDAQICGRGRGRRLSRRSRGGSRRGTPWRRTKSLCRLAAAKLRSSMTMAWTAASPPSVSNAEHAARKLSWCRQSTASIISTDTSLSKRPASRASRHRAPSPDRQGRPRRPVFRHSNVAPPRQSWSSPGSRNGRPRERRARPIPSRSRQGDHLVAGRASSRGARSLPAAHRRGSRRAASNKAQEYVIVSSSISAKNSLDTS